MIKYTTNTDLNALAYQDARSIFRWTLDLMDSDTITETQMVNLKLIRRAAQRAIFIANISLCEAATQLTWREVELLFETRMCNSQVKRWGHTIMLNGRDIILASGYTDIDQLIETINNFNK